MIVAGSRILRIHEIGRIDVDELVVGELDSVRILDLFVRNVWDFPTHG
jgi:hypothetical protein